MHLVDGEDVLIADHPASFRFVVERRYRSEALWAKLTANGLKNIDRPFSFHAAARELDPLLNDAGVVSPGRLTVHAAEGQAKACA
jgi:hypothetical protein